MQEFLGLRVVECNRLEEDYSSLTLFSLEFLKIVEYYPQNKNKKVGYSYIFYLPFFKNCFVIFPRLWSV